MVWGKVDWPNGLRYAYLCGFSVCGDTGIALLCCFLGGRELSCLLKIRLGFHSIYHKY